MSILEGQGIKTKHQSSLISREKKKTYVYGKILVGTCSNQQRGTFSHERESVIGDIHVVMETEVWKPLTGTSTPCDFFHSFFSFFPGNCRTPNLPSPHPKNCLDPFLILCCFFQVILLTSHVNCHLSVGFPSQQLQLNLHPSSQSVLFALVSLTSPLTLSMACQTPPNQTARKLRVIADSLLLHI